MEIQAKNKGKTIHQKRKIGVISYKEKSFLPVTSVDYKVVVLNGVSTITQISTYEAIGQEITEVGFFYPKSIQGAFSQLKVFYGDKIIETEIIKVEKAQAMFNESKNKDSSPSGISFNHEKMRDVVYTWIGNILPGNELRVEFSILEEVRQGKKGEWALKIPAELQSLSTSCLDQNSSSETEGKEIIMENHKLKSGELPWNIEVLLSLKKDKFEFNSSSHPLIVEEIEETGFVKYSLDPTKPQSLQENFVFKYRDLEQKSLKIVKWEKNEETPYAFQLHIDPKSLIHETNEQGEGDDKKEEKTSLENFQGEFIFIVDRSGSMSGQPIQVTREALFYSLKSLPKESIFNIVSFGSQVDFMYEESVPVTNKNISDAIQKVKSFKADLGLKNIRHPLSKVLEAPDSKNHPKLIFFLTDGEEWNMDELLEEVEENLGSSRIFAVGIGPNFSVSLGESGLGGSAKCYEMDKASDKIVELVGDSMQPYHVIFDFKTNGELLKYDEFFSKNRTVKVLPGERFSINGFVSHDVEAQGYLEVEFKVKGAINKIVKPQFIT